MQPTAQPPTESAIALEGEPRARVWLREMAGHATGSGLLALLDQAFVSGANFLMFVIVGRVCGEGGLGIFGLAMTFVVLLAAVQQSVISAPYTIYSNRLVGEERRIYSGSALIHLGLLIPVAIAAMGVSVAVSSLAFPELGLTAVLIALGSMVPFLLLREFLRRVAFAQWRMDMALAIDSLTAMLQLGLVVGIAVGGWLTPWLAYIAMGTACALASSSYLAVRRGQFRFCWSEARRSIRRDWQLGRWVFVQQLATVAHMYVCHWILALSIGVESAGIFTACVSVVMLCNPFLQAMGNYFAPRFARSMAEEGSPAVRSLFWHCSALVGAIVLVFCLILATLGGSAVELLYDGPAFAGLGTVVALLAMRMLIYSSRLGAYHGLLVQERADLSLLATCLGLATTCLASVVLIQHWGIVGAALAWLAGTLVETALQLGCFFLVNRAAAVEPAVVEGSL